jgi:enamine deaminase RidA (YjgF/YER057c/UK114 family)
MPPTIIEPKDLFDAQRFGFSQAVTAKPGRLVAVSGQVAVDQAFQLVGAGDLVAQTNQALRNVEAALAAAGATRRDVTRLRVFVVALSLEKAMSAGGVIGEFFAGQFPAQTMVGVTSLVSPDWLIEIEAEAVVEG